MEINRWILLLIIPAACAAQGGFARFDGGTGAAVKSPSAPLITVGVSPPTTFECSLTNLYQFSPFHSDQRFIETEWGVLAGLKHHRWRAVLNHCDAFGIWRKLNPELGWGWVPNRILRMEISAGSSILLVPGERDYEFSCGAGIGAQLKRVTVGTLWNGEHLSENPDRSIPKGTVTFLAVMDESKLGSQGVTVRWNHTDREGSLTLSESFAPLPWWRVGITMQSAPFELGLSMIISTQLLSGGALFVRSPELGWSQTAAVQKRIWR